MVRADEEHGDLAIVGCRVRNVAEFVMEQPAVAVPADDEQVKTVLGGVFAD
jgi:metal-dependent hydrolase (beta-lactamase superfamily II)